MKNNEIIVAITVTYNRTKTLSKCVRALVNQKYPLDKIVIVDNNSSDAEKEKLKKLVKKFPMCEVLWLKQNTGGAGGFEAGMSFAREKYSPDWYWVMDDDAYPREDCLEKLVENRKKYPLAGCFAPVIFGIDLQQYQLYHHKYLNKFTLKERQVVNDYNDLKEITEIEANAFVGPLFSASAVQKVGIADGSLFIYGDDTEYTYRVSRQYKIYLIKDAIIDHQDPPISGNYMKPEAWWKEYYAIRNKYFMIREFGRNKLEYSVGYFIFSLKNMKLMIAALIKSKYNGFHKLRIKLLWKAMYDGMYNRRGKTIDPVKYNNRFRDN